VGFYGNPWPNSASARKGEKGEKGRLPDDLDQRRKPSVIGLTLRKWGRHLVRLLFEEEGKNYARGENRMFP